MIIARGLDEIDLARAQLAIAGRSVAYVPTMGALHAGHRSLMALAHEYGDAVIVSIFVNPLQFGPDEDYARYPRQLEADLEICRDAGVDVVFTPAVSDLYPGRAAGERQRGCARLDPGGRVAAGALRRRAHRGRASSSTSSGPTSRSSARRTPSSSR